MKGRGTPWTGRQSIWPHTLIPMGNLGTPINLSESLDCRRKLEFPERTHVNTENAKNMQTPHRKSPAGSWTRNLLATALTTKPPRCPCKNICLQASVKWISVIKKSGSEFLHKNIQKKQHNCLHLLQLLYAAESLVCIVQYICHYMNMIF